MVSCWNILAITHSKAQSQYNTIPSNVGQSIASRKDLKEHIHLGAACLGKYTALVVHMYVRTYVY